MACKKWTAYSWRTCWFVVILEKFVESIIGIPFAIVDATGCMVCIGRLEGILSAKDEHFGDKTESDISHNKTITSNVEMIYLTGIVQIMP